MGGRFLTLALLTLVAACPADNGNTPELSFGGTTIGSLFGTAMTTPMQISFNIPMDADAGTMFVEMWSGTDWEPLLPSRGLVDPTRICSYASPEWVDQFEFHWWPIDWDTCVIADQHWPQGAYFRWTPSSFRSVAGDAMDDSIWADHIYFDSCKYDTAEHCTGVPFPPDYH